MSDLKMSCPGCNSWTSAVGQARRDGAPCPSCGLSADAAAAIEAAQKRHADKDMIERCTAAEMRAADAEAENARLRRLVDSIRDLLA